ncbi:MAG: sigma-54-dependent Fis family transcriptional regulator [Nitrospirae bacterium]|nr:sigma-54-dependent Fis family transcriptional regulator [Nitrospirota bacterium]
MLKPTVLIVDDEEGIRESLAGILEDEGYDVLNAKSGEESLSMLKENSPDLILLDIWLTGMDGIQTLQEIKSLRPDIPVIMISGHGNIEIAVKAVKLGAYDFLEKPLSLERVLLVSKRAVEKRTLEIENISLRENLIKRHKLIGESNKIKELREQIEMAAKSNSRVLISGESGTGKEVVAHLLHEKSPRSGKPFIEVNCAAIPQELIESELFGHEKGSFTGALEKKKGKFELADGGTLFLDEIGDMSLQTQSKVLRIIETQEFQRVGGNKNITVDYFRLNVIPLSIPTLRDRKEDIAILVEYFLESLAIEYGKHPKKIMPDTLTAIESYNWPGNVRELKNILERLVIMTPSNSITDRNIFISDKHKESNYFGFKTLKDARDAFEKDYLIKKLEENNWNISKTAEVLDIERSNLHRKIKAYGIKIP